LEKFDSCGQAEDDHFSAVALHKKAHRLNAAFLPPLYALEKLLDLSLLSRLPGHGGAPIIRVGAEGLIPGEIQDDAFGAVLRQLAAQEDVRTILEASNLARALHTLHRLVC
jgi:hypothetical protein